MNERTRMTSVAAALVATVLMVGTAVAALMSRPSISITSPAADATISGNTIPVKVAVTNFNLECSNIGKTNAPMGEGHVHVMVDGMDMAHLIGPYCSTGISIPGQGLAPGKHMITVALANDTHALNSLPVSVPFNYEPTSPNAEPMAMAGGKPTVSVVSPVSGATVGRRFNLVLAVRHFDLSCALEGKRDIEGWGHIHIMVEQDGETSASATTPMLTMLNTPEGMKMGQMLMQQTGMTQAQLKPMLSMAMPSMIGMPCSKTFPIDLSTWHSGPAKIVVQLANNDHMPTMSAAPAVVNVDVK